MMPIPPKIWVTGTDTAVGKTVVAGLLTWGLAADYWKPIQTGIEEESDTAWIQQYALQPGQRTHPERYALALPLSPHLSAAAAGVDIQVDDFVLPVAERLVVEGCGGVMVPLNAKGDLLIDLMAHLSLPTVVVSRTTLGTINHTLLTLAALRQKGIPILGIIFNGVPNAANRAAIAHFGQIPILGEIPPQATFNANIWRELFSFLSWSCNV